MDIQKEAQHEEEFHAAKEQGIEPEKISEQIQDEMKIGQKDEDISTKEAQEQLVEDDEIEPWEAGFAQGASQDNQLGQDALTGEALLDIEDVYEEEIDGKLYRFASEENAIRFRKKRME